MIATELVHWSFLELAAIIIGVSKTAMPALSPLAVVVFAWQLSSQAAAGALVLLLLVGDLTAVGTYWRHGDWRALRRLLPAVLGGMVIGAIVLAMIDEALLRRLIGAILIVILAFTVYQRMPTRHRVGQGNGIVADGLSAHNRTLGALFFGVLGGFTTMTANVGGPVMSAYFLSLRILVDAFLGTAAWFFLVVNLIKLPITIGLGFLTMPDVLMMLPLIPGVLVGAWVGARWVSVIRLWLFELIAGVLTFVSAVALLV